MRNGASWRRTATCVAAAVIGTAASPALAQTKIDGADTAWMIAATALVLMMTIPGLALFYAGMVRKKNVLATMVQSVAATALVSILWALAGYSLAFSGDGALIGTLSRTLFSIGIDSVNPAAGTIPEAVFLVYQMTFAIITVALVAGSVVDRMRFSAFLSFSVGWLLIVYVPVAHWVWGGGFLGRLGLLDFAGGTVVHINAGIAGLVAALVLGSRHGYGSENLAPYDLSMAVIGTGLLWVGWFGFNGGSALGAGSRAAMAILATHLAACAGALTWMVLEWRKRGQPSVLGIISGAIAGLGTITPASGFVLPWHAVVIGILAGLACFWACIQIKPRLGYDDSLDVFGVHGVGGALGTLLTGVFAAGAISAGPDAPGGFPGLLEGNPRQLLIQLIGVLVTCRLVGARHVRAVESDRLVHRTAGKPRSRADGFGHQPAWRGAAVKRRPSPRLAGRPLGGRDGIDRNPACRFFGQTWRLFVRQPVPALVPWRDRNPHSFQKDRSAAVELARGLILCCPGAMPAGGGPSSAKPIVARSAVA